MPIGLSAYERSRGRPVASRVRPPRESVGDIKATYRTPALLLPSNSGIGPYPLMTYADAFAHKNDILIYKRLTARGVLSMR